MPRTSGLTADLNGTQRKLIRNIDLASSRTATSLVIDCTLVAFHVQIESRELQAARKVASDRFEIRVLGARI